MGVQTFWLDCISLPFSDIREMDAQAVCSQTIPVCLTGLGALSLLSPLCVLTEAQQITGLPAADYSPLSQKQRPFYTGGTSNAIMNILNVAVYGGRLFHINFLRWPLFVDV